MVYFKFQKAKKPMRIYIYKLYFFRAIRFSYYLCWNYASQKNAKLCQLKDPLFGLAVLVGGIASPSLYVVMLAGDGITLAARV